MREGRGVGVMKCHEKIPLFWINSLTIVWAWQWAPVSALEYHNLCTHVTVSGGFVLQPHIVWHDTQGHLSITHSGTALYPCDRSLCRWSRKMSWSLHAFCVHGTRAFEARLGGPPPNSVTANRKRPFLCCSPLFISLPCTRNISESTFALKSSQILKTLQPIGKSHVWVIEPCLPYCEARERFIREPAWVSPS